MDLTLILFVEAYHFFVLIGLSLAKSDVVKSASLYLKLPPVVELPIIHSEPIKSVIRLEL